MESDRPAWQGGSAWRVSRDPLVSIGQIEGEEPYLFNGVVGARLLSDGRIVVADGGSRELRFFSLEGEHLETVGGAGGGPGELGFMDDFWLGENDTLMVGQMMRVSVFDSAGEFSRNVSLEPSEGARLAAPKGQLSGGRIWGTSGSRGFGPADAGKVVLDSIRFNWYYPDGAFGGEMAVLPSTPRWGLQTGGALTFPSLPFSVRPSAVAVDSLLWVTGGHNAEIRAWSPAGVRRIVRWEKQGREVSDAVRRTLRDHMLDGLADENERRRTEVFLAEAPVPDSLPLYERILADGAGNLWLEQYRLPSAAGPDVYDVIAADGSWLGSVEIPAGLEVKHITEAMLLGVSRDSQRVEHVQVYRLIKP